MKKHQKHAKLTKPNIGNFGRNELALVGAPCGLIQTFAKEIIDESTISVTYIDADHAFGDSEIEAPQCNELTDKIKFFRYDKSALNDWDKKILLNDQDLVLVNGNHFQANKQFVFIHSKKEASLKKRLKQLTNVAAYILCEESEKPYEWLLEKIGEKPIFKISEIIKVRDLISNLFPAPEVKGLILAGGKSIRMGEDKGQINYYGKSQVDYLSNEFKKTDIETYISCRADQYENRIRITDKFEGLGPFGAITSAFQTDPNAAWLVVACDLPMVDQSVFERLLKERDASKLATCFYNPETDFPDPLITLWEPRAYMRLLEFLALGYSCPRKVLINSDVKIVHLENPEILKNVNTQVEREAFITA